VEKLLCTLHLHTGNGAQLQVGLPFCVVTGENVEARSGTVGYRSPQRNKPAPCNKFEISVLVTVINAHNWKLKYPNNEIQIS
jgi:hypothetical protein